LVGEHLRAYGVVGVGRTQDSIAQRRLVQHYALIIAKVCITRAGQLDSASYAVAENCYGSLHTEVVELRIAL
jgi:hypothetical protein